MSERGGWDGKDASKVQIAMTTLTRLTVSRFAWVPCGTNAHRFLRIGQAQMRTLVLADGTIVYGV